MFPHKHIAKIVMDDNNGKHINDINDESESESEVKIADVAIPVAAAAEMAMQDQEKQGAKCCFFCCDYRRAVVAISIICIIYYIIMIILAATGAALTFAVSAIDDFTQEDKDNFEEIGNKEIALIVECAVFVFFNIWTLCAALRYCTCMLSTNVILILIQFGFNIYNAWSRGVFNIGKFIAWIVMSVIGYGLYLYPVIGLISEIKSGVMRQETYPREAYSCCCNPKKQFK